MAIIGTLPNNIQNGQSVDANPVMADFNFIVNQVNANANPLGTLTAPSGTRMSFHQAAAPSGWVIDATVTNHTCLYQTVGGSIVSVGAGYTSFCFSGYATDGHALTTAELATHNHGVTDPTHTHSSPPHSHIPGDGGAFYTNVNGGTNYGPGGTTTNTTPITGTTAVSINAASTGISIQNNGSGTAHTHTITTQFQYITMCVAQKS